MLCAVFRMSKPIEVLHIYINICVIYFLFSQERTFLILDIGLFSGATLNQTNIRKVTPALTIKDCKNTIQEALLTKKEF